MASTNSDSVLWVVGETTGHDVYGATAVAPPSNFIKATATTTPVGAPDGLPIYLTSDDKIYLWDAVAAGWIGPYAKAT